MEEDQGEKLLAAFDRMAERLERTSTNRGNSSINVNAGGAGVWVVAWVAGLACAFMLGLSISDARSNAQEFQRAANERAELRKRDNDFQDYISAIYQVAPELQKRIEAEKAEEPK